MRSDMLAGRSRRCRRRYRGDHPDATPRTASIKAFADRQVAATGLLPTIDDVAKAFAMSPAKVERHFRVLGLL